MSTASPNDTEMSQGEVVDAPGENASSELQDPASMKIKDITQELKDRNIEFADCFDKDSLVKRLKDARNGVVKSEKKSETKVNKPVESNTTTSTASSTKSTGLSTFDKDSVMKDLRKLKISELRTELGQRGIRWRHMIEKDELVTALANEMEKAANFSVTGKLKPSEVTDIDESILEKELEGPSVTPIVLDVYATWCGPCQMMAPQFKEAAAELGSTVRFVKMDSDKNPSMASRLRVGGLPTTIVFDAQGKELKRQEGALMKDNIVQLVRPYI